MKRITYFFIVMASMLMMAMTSCVNENIGGGVINSKYNVAELDEQAAAVETSLNVIDEMQGGLSELVDNGRAKGLEAAQNNLSAAEAALEKHVAYLESGVSLLDGTMATMAMQKLLAEAVGEVEGSLMLSGVEVKSLSKQFKALEESVKDWIGKSYEEYYSAVEADSKTEYLLSDLDGKLFNQKLSVGGLLSDIEAGLRDKDCYDELSDLSESVENNETVASELDNSISGIADQLEVEYGKAIEAAATRSAEYDFAALTALNENANAVLLEVDNTLSGLITRIAACEATLEELKEKLKEVDGKVDELLGLIQSVTFISEFSDDKAYAYYTLTNQTDNDYAVQGYKLRQRAGSIELNYLVRPASAVTALAEEANRSNMAVKAYYAEKISTAATKDMIDMAIDAVVADPNTGLLTLTVGDALLSKAFYMKETGAKVALSIQTGKTDIMSKFVEIVPKDDSETIYIETFELAKDELEVKVGETTKIETIITPANATVLGFTHDFNDDQTMVIGEDGTIEARAEKVVTFNITSKGVNEWGQNLTKQCKVTIKPNISIVSPGFVELGSTADFVVDASESIKSSINKITWRMKDKYTNYASINSSAEDKYIGVITPIVHSHNPSDKTYDDVYVICNIDGTDYESKIKIIYQQPKGIQIEGRGATDNALTLKLGQTSNILDPNKLSFDEGVDQNQFGFELVCLPTTIADIDYNDNTILTGDKLKSGTGTTGNATIKITAKSDNGQLYGSPAYREIYLKVEPVYVTALTLKIGEDTINNGDIIDLNAGSSTNVGVVYTTDAAGLDPTDNSIIWTSDNSKVTVANGAISAAADGTGEVANITATSNAVADGNDPVTVKFKVNVTSAWHEFEVGHYVFRTFNGGIRFSTNATKNVGESLCGVVFAKMNPRAFDTRLPEACIHGLAVSIDSECSSTTFWTETPNYDAIHQYGIDNGYYNFRGYDTMQGYYNCTESPYGFENTQLFRNYVKLCAENGITDWRNPEGIFSSPLITALESFIGGSYSTRPDETSEWYYPSFCEMKLISTAVSQNDLNTILSNVWGHKLLSDEFYYVMNDNGSTYALGVNPVTGAYNTIPKLSYSGATYKARYIFAF